MTQGASAQRLPRCDLQARLEQAGTRCAFAVVALTSSFLAISLLPSPPCELSRCRNPAGDGGPDRHLGGRPPAHRRGDLLVRQALEQAGTALTGSSHVTIPGYAAGIAGRLENPAAHRKQITFAC